MLDLIAKIALNPYKISSFWLFLEHKNEGEESRKYDLIWNIISHSTSAWDIGTRD
jgi:hypothetical protein